MRLGGGRAPSAEVRKELFRFETFLDATVELKGVTAAVPSALRTLKTPVADSAALFEDTILTRHPTMLAANRHRLT